MGFAVPSVVLVTIKENVQKMNCNQKRLREIYERLANRNGPEGERTGKTTDQRRN
jgi:hypothetical protein